ncbi:MAG: glycosyltransferase [Ilumatobacteraceae bacterium]
MRSFNNVGVSVVVPIYCAANRLASLVQRINSELEGFRDFEILLIDDGSTDSSWLEITKLAHENSSVVGVRLGRNSGQHAALLAGIRTAKHGVVVTIDDDLQNPPSEIMKLLDALTADVDVVYGFSADIRQSIWRRILSKGSRRFLSSALGFKSSIEMSSFRAFRTDLRDSFSQPIGPSVSIDALLTWSTSRFATVEVEHHERMEGKSNYNLRKLIKFMMDTTTSYSALPLRFASLIGSFVMVIGFLLLNWIVGRRIVTGNSVPGFPLLASAITIFSGTQLLMLGVLGEYIGKIHFRSMNKPSYTITQSTDER